MVEEFLDPISSRASRARGRPSLLRRGAPPSAREHVRRKDRARRGLSLRPAVTPAWPQQAEQRAGRPAGARHCAAGEDRRGPGLLEAGWKLSSLIRQVITGRPLPVPKRHRVGAIISARLREAAAGPVPSPGCVESGSTWRLSEIPPRSSSMPSGSDDPYRDPVARPYGQAGAGAGAIREGVAGRARGRGARLGPTPPPRPGRVLYRSGRGARRQRGEAPGGAPVTREVRAHTSRPGRPTTCAPAGLRPDPTAPATAAVVGGSSCHVVPGLLSAGRRCRSFWRKRWARARSAPAGNAEPLRHLRHVRGVGPGRPTSVHARRKSGDLGQEGPHQAGKGQTFTRLYVPVPSCLPLEYWRINSPSA